MATLRSYALGGSPPMPSSVPLYLFRELRKIRDVFEGIVAQCPVSASFADGYLTITLPSGVFKIAAEKQE